MRYLNTLALIAVAVLIIGTSSTAEVFAKRPSNPPDLEQRVTDLEGQVADHELRIQAEEQNTAGQNQRLDSLEQEQETQNSRLDALESQPPVTGGIKVFDSSDPSQFVGRLVSIVPEGYRNQDGRGVARHMTIFIPSAGKFAELEWNNFEPTERTKLDVFYFDEPGCTGNAYIPDGADPADPYNLLDDYFLYYHIRTKKFYKRGEGVPVFIESKLYAGGNCVPEADDTNRRLLIEVDMPFNLPLQKPLRFE